MMMLCDPGYVRGKLYERDHGICTRCGIDCQAVRAAVRDMWDRVECQAERQKWIGGILRTTVAFFAEHNLERHRTMWEAHHKIAVVEGGGECGLDNYETLCVWCHKRETRELARRRSELRRGQFALDE
jgi:5-methylcytosine-specific restriction endonuclease McrA